MPAHKKPNRDRLELRAGPLGAEFFDRVAVHATRSGETMSEYVRRAVQLRMDGENDMVQWIKSKKKKGAKP